MDIISKADKQIYKLALLNDKITEDKLLKVLKRYNLIESLCTIGNTYQKMLQSTKGNNLRIVNCKVENSEYFLRSDMLMKLVHYLIKSG